MWLRLFHRIPYLWAAVFAGALFVLQILEHTALFFALASAAYILVATAAFNFANGLTTLPGVYIFCNAVETCVLGITVKALLGQPGESNLKVGVETMQLELLGMLGMLCAVVIERKFRRPRAFLPTYLPLPNLRAVFLACGGLGMVAEIVSLAGPGNPKPGSLFSLFRQLNYLIPLAIILGTIDTVRRTKGQRSLTPFLALIMIFPTLDSLITFSKSGFFQAPVAWLLAVFASRYRLKVVNLVTIGIVSYVLLAYATPYSQWGRNFKGEGTAVENIPAAIYLLQNFDLVQNGYRDSNSSEESLLGDYYAPWHSALLERLTMLPPDDDLIEITDRKGTFGFQPLLLSIENLVPHILFPNKPNVYFGNTYAHEIGNLSEGDTDTGISYNISADAYHEGALWGVLVVEPIYLACIFLMLSSVFGRTNDHPLTLVMALVITHLAPEGALWGTAGLITTAVVCVFLAFVCRYILTPLGSIFEPAARPGRRDLPSEGGLQEI